MYTNLQFSTVLGGALLQPGLAPDLAAAAAVLRALDVDVAP